MFLIECHNREILGLVHEFLCITLFGNIHRHHIVLSPNGAQSAPADCHGIALLTVTSAKQHAPSRENIERILKTRLLYVELNKTAILDYGGSRCVFLAK